MAKLSVIIPVYNTDFEMFSKCLESVHNSSIKDLEVIVVDDGSSVDYSSLIKKYKNFKFFKNENMGTLEARLFGVSHATGDYVGFIDSDDALSFDYLEAMVTRATQTNADIVINDWAFWTEKTKHVCANDSTIKTNFIVENDMVLLRYFRAFGTEHSYYVLWNKIFRKSVIQGAVEKIKKLNLPKMLFAEDVLITFFAFSLAKKLANIHLGHYYYRIHNGQQIYISGSEKLESQIMSMAKVFEVMEAELKNTNRYDELSTRLYDWKKIMASSAYEVAKNSKYTDMFEKIKSAYGVKKLTKLPWVAHRPYAKHKLLPKNLDEIEEALQKVFFSNKHLIVYVKKHSYAFDELVIMKLLLGKRFDITHQKDSADVLMPKEKYSLKLKFIHNNFIYSVGMLLFPKGSKIRKKLKSKL